jgi:hypothetical protein
MATEFEDKPNKVVVNPKDVNKVIVQEQNNHVEIGTGGPQGIQGNAATVAIGTTTTGNPGTSANVTNSGNATAAIFNFTIPRGEIGATGPQGPSGVIAVTSPITNSGTSTSATIGIDQSLLAIGQSQVANLTTDLAAKANLAGGNSFTGTQTITNSAITDKPLVVNAITGQTNYLLDLQVNGASQAYVASNGIINASAMIANSGQANVFGGTTISGVILAARTSNAAIIPFAVRSAVSQTADLTQWQSNAGTVLSSVDKNGSISAPFFGSTTANRSYLQTNGDTGSLQIFAGAAALKALVVKGATSQSANILEVQDSTGAAVFSVSPYSETWNKGNLYVGSAGNYGRLSVLTGAAVVGAVIRGAVSQTANLQEWQDSTGAILASLSGSGRIYTARTSAGSTSDFTATANFWSNNATTVGAIIRGAVSQTANLQEWQDSAGTVKLQINKDGDLQLNGNASIINGGGGPNLQFGSGLVATARGASQIPLTLKGAASQSANLQEWQNSSGTVLASISSAGTASFADLTISGNFTVSGTTTNLNSVNLVIEDKNIVLADVATPTDTTADGAGITIMGATNKTLTWVQSTGLFTFSNGLSAPTAIFTPTASATGLIIKAAVSQSANLFEFQDSSGTAYGYINATGSLRIGSIGATAAGNSVLQPGGDTNGFLIQTVNTGNKGLVIKGAASQTANLQEWQNSSGTVLTSIDSTGQVRAVSIGVNGTSSGIAYARFSNGSGDTTAATMAIRAIASQTGNLQEWQDSAGARQGFVGPGGNTLQFPGITANYSLLAQTTNVAVVPLTVKGAASQTANLQEWQDSAGTVIGRFSSGGSFLASSYVQAGSMGSVLGQITSYAGAATTIGMVIRGAASQTADLFQWQNSAGTVLGRLNGSGSLIVGTEFTITGGGGQGAVIQATAGADSVKGIVVRGYSATQSADLQQWQTNAGVALAKVGSTGALTLINPNVSTGLAMPSPAITFNGYAWNSSTGNQSISGQILVDAYSNNTNPTVSKFSFKLAAESGTPAEVASITSGGMFFNAGGFDSSGTAVQALLRNTTAATTGTQQSSPKLELRGRGWNSAQGDIPFNTYIQSTVTGNNANPFTTRIGLFAAPGANSSTAIEVLSASSLGTVGINAFNPTAALDVRTLQTTTVNMVIRPIVSQTADMTQWQNYLGATVAGVDIYGNAGFGGATPASGYGLKAFTNGNAAVIGILVKGASGQTANLQEWQDSAGSIVAAVNNIGTIRGGIFASTTSGLTWIQPNYDTNGMGVQTGAAAHKGLVIRGAASQSADLLQVQDTSANVLFSVRPNLNGSWGNDAVNINGPTQISPTSSGTGYGLFVKSGYSAAIGLLIRAVTSQTSDLLQMQNSAGTVISGFDAAGNLYANSTTYGFSAYATAPANDTYWKIATLPITNSSTYDHVVVDAVLDDAWGSTAKSHVRVMLGNRNAFTYRYYLDGPVRVNNRVLAYTEVDGSVSVYMQVKAAAYTSFSYNITQAIGATTYKNPASTTTAPTGTLAFDSGVISTYIPQMYLPYTGAAQINGRTVAFLDNPVFSGTVTAQASSDTTIALIAKGFSATQSVSAFEVQRSDGNVSFAVGYNSISLNRVTTAAAGLLVLSANSGGVPLTVRGRTGQSVNLQEWQDPTGATVLASISPTGVFSAVSKSFLIDHPTKPGKKLRHGSLEGPENGVYVRGTITDNIIELPDYWTALVHAESITVSLTAIGKYQRLSVKKIEGNRVYIRGPRRIHAHYVVFAERADTPRLELEE